MPVLDSIGDMSQHFISIWLNITVKCIDFEAHKT